MFFDTHAHYDDKAFDQDRERLLPALKEAGIERIINCGADLKSSESTLVLSQQYDFIYAAVGVHPEEVGKLEIEDVSMLYNMAASSEKTVAVGEIGLDYHYKDNAPADIQQEWFIEQIELAKELELPIIVHSRDAARDTFEICRDYDGAMFGGVIHAYSGAPELAQEYIKLGFSIGIGGMVTFSNAKRVAATVEAIPLEKILLETDCPYLAPVPNRGKRNDSRNLKYVAEAIAAIKGISAEEVARVTMQNAKTLFGVL